MAEEKEEGGHKNKHFLSNLPLLHTLLSSSSGPLESLSSSCRCKWPCCAKWWWWLASAKLWCKWCRWWLLLVADALRSRGLCGDGDRPPASRFKCSALATLAAPPPPNMSVIMNRDRDGSTAIDPRCIGTVMLRSWADAFGEVPFGDSSSVLVIVDDFGLTPVECHCSTILMDLCQAEQITHTRGVLVGCVRFPLSVWQFFCCANPLKCFRN